MKGLKSNWIKDLPWWVFALGLIVLGFVVVMVWLLTPKQFSGPLRILIPTPAPELLNQTDSFQAFNSLCSAYTVNGDDFHIWQPYKVKWTGFVEKVETKRGTNQKQAYINLDEPGTSVDVVLYIDDRLIASFEPGASVMFQGNYSDMSATYLIDSHCTMYLDDVILLK